MILLQNLPEADIEFDTHPDDPENVFVTDLYILLRNLLAIPDPRSGDTGFRESRRNLQIQYVRLYASCDILPMIGAWATEVIKLVKRHHDAFNPEQSTGAQQQNRQPGAAKEGSMYGLAPPLKHAMWVLFDYIYYMKLGAQMQNVYLWIGHPEMILYRWR